MNYVYFKENNQYVKVNIRTGVIKLRRDYPYIYIPKATEKQMVFFRKLWEFRKDIENALWFGSRNYVRDRIRQIWCDRLKGGTSERRNKRGTVRRS